MIDDHPFISPIFLGLLEYFRESVNIEFHPLPVSINTPRNFYRSLNALFDDALRILPVQNGSDWFKSEIENRFIV